MQLEALADNIIIEQDEDVTTAAEGRIILSKGTPQFRGRVLSKGPDVRNDIQVGDYVMYAKWHGEMYEVASGDEKRIIRAGKDVCEVLASIVNGRMVPVRDHAIVEIELEEKHGAIAMPEMFQKQRPFRGHITALGPEAKKSLKVGDYVAYARWHGYEHEFDGRTYIIIRAGERVCEILCKFEE